MKRVRFLASLVAVFLVFSSVFCANAQTDFGRYDSSKFSFVIGDVTAAPGTIALVPVYVENNAGFWGSSMQFSYDKEKLTPVVDTDGSLIVKRGSMFEKYDEVWGGAVDNENGTVTVLIDGLSVTENNTQNGLMFTMSFTVNSGSKQDDKTEISFANFDSFSLLDVDGNDVEINSFKSGFVTTPVFGDLNNDKLVTTKDVLLFRRFLAKQPVEINKANADLDFNGTPSSKDLLLLRKYLAGYHVNPWYTA